MDPISERLHQAIAALRLTATEGYADVLLGEQTRKRAKALAEAMDLEVDHQADNTTEKSGATGNRTPI